MFELIAESKDVLLSSKISDWLKSTFVTLTPRNCPHMNLQMDKSQFGFFIRPSMRGTTFSRNVLSERYLDMNVDVYTICYMNYREAFDLKMIEILRIIEIDASIQNFIDISISSG